MPLFDRVNLIVDWKNKVQQVNIKEFHINKIKRLCVHAGFIPFIIIKWSKPHSSHRMLI